MVNGYRVARQPSLGMFAAAAIAFMGMQRCYRHPRYPGDCAVVARGHALLMYATMGHYTLTAVYGGDANFTGSSVTNQVTITGPMVNAGPDASVVRGNLFTSAGSFTQVGTSATWTATVDYGDGSNAQPLSLAGMTFALSHTFANAGMYSVIVRVTDDTNHTGTDAVMVTVTYPASGVFGDVSGDSVVTCQDLTIAGSVVGKRTGQVGFFPTADIDRNGMIDIRDISAISRLLPAGAHC